MVQMLIAFLQFYTAGVVTVLREARATQAIKLAAIKVSLPLMHGRGLPYYI